VLLCSAVISGYITVSKVSLLAIQVGLMCRRMHILSALRLSAPNAQGRHKRWK